MVKTFVEGVDPDLLKHILGQVGRMLDQLPERIADAIKGDAKQDAADRLQPQVEEAKRTIAEELNKFMVERHIWPTINVAASLPKDELAELAEALVSLTTIKRKISLGLETVGGPVDVAVVSKGDGFVWIKRKHYFPAELNPTFARAYLDR